MGHGRAFSSHACSERGTIALIWGIALVMVFGFMAMIMDVGRVNTTHSELQTFADHVALAAAGELDGRASAITRATSAAANLISDSQTFADGAPALSGPVDYTLTFHTTLPASDTTPLGANATTDPNQAAFVQVEITPRTQPMFFTAALQSILGTGTGPVDAQIQAQAVAGFTQDACAITPIMFCLPTPGFKANAHIGEMIKLRSRGGGNSWAPGNWAFLDPTNADLGPTCQGLNGAKLLTCLVGAELTVSKCYTTRGVDTEPGQKVGLENAAFDVRFDIFKSGMKKEDDNPIFAPAPNVVAGMIPKNGTCIGQNADPSPDSVGLPRDSCFATGSCAHNDRFGNGMWDYAGYVAANHTGDDSALMSPQVTAHVGARFAGSGTRYELYLREIYAAGGPASSTPILNGLAESGRPQCSDYQSSKPERRVVVAAGIDCGSHQINGRTLGVPVEEYFEVFLTEPVGKVGNDIDIFGEILGSAGGDGYGAVGTGGLFRDVVQLYR